MVKRDAFKFIDIVSVRLVPRSKSSLVSIMFLNKGQ